jgi:hypothetical protein
MRSLALVGFFFVVGLSTPPKNLSTQETDQGTSAAKVQQQIELMLAAKPPFNSLPGLSRGYRSLFAKAGEDGLRKLQLHTNDGVALYAAWQEVAMTVPEVHPGDATRLRPDRHKLNWFLGFLEGRLRIQAPPWWGEMLLDMRANHRENIYSGQPKERPYHKAGIDHALAPLDTTLEREGGKIIMRVGKESVLIPESLLNISDNQLVCNVSAFVKPQRCYIAVHGDGGEPFKLACIDRMTAKILWQVEVWGTWWGKSSGPQRMWVSVMEQDKRVLVFGAAGNGLHVEAFHIDDGRNLFRFCSYY